MLNSFYLTFGNILSNFQNESDIKIIRISFDEEVEWDFVSRIEIRFSRFCLTSLFPTLCSFNRHVLLFCRLRPQWPKSGPLPPLGPSSVHLTILSVSLSAFHSHRKAFFYVLGFQTGSATEWPLPWAAPYKLRNTIQYKHCHCFHSDSASPKLCKRRRVILIIFPYGTT